MANSIIIIIMMIIIHFNISQHSRSPYKAEIKTEQNKTNVLKRSIK